MKGVIENMSLALDGDLRVTVQVPRHHLEELDGLRESPLSIEIKKWREKRSLSQNAYAWTLITKIAQSMNPPLNKEEVYVEMLKRYGQGGIVTVQKDKADMALRAFDYYIQKGEGITNGKEFIHYMVYVGSSKYDSQEMSVFVSGIVNEAQELGIETMTPDEIARLNL